MDSTLPAPESPARPPSPAIRKKKARLKKRRRHRSPAVRYSLVAVGLLAAGLFAQLAVHTYRADPRDARAIAERELRLNTLADGERVIRMVSVFQRPSLDYFRATRGLLVLTDRRLLFLGLQPRDLLGSGDSPPTFVERDFPVDTLVSLRPGRTFFGIAKAIVLETPDATMKFGIPSEAWGKANMLFHAMQARQERSYAEGVRAKRLRDALAGQRREAAAVAQQPRYYTVRRGDAISTIAARWNTTPDQLRAWNNLPDNRIRVGQKLLVKPQANESMMAGEVERR